MVGVLAILFAIPGRAADLNPAVPSATSIEKSVEARSLAWIKTAIDRDIPALFASDDRGRRQCLTQGLRICSSESTQWQYCATASPASTAPLTQVPGTADENAISNAGSGFRQLRVRAMPPAYA